MQEEHTREERLQVLEMVASGKISPQEAANLLEAMEGTGRAEKGAGKKGRFLRVKVWDNATNKPVVNVNLPIGLVKWGLGFAKWGMKMGQAHSPELKNANVDWDSVDWDSISTLIEEGAEGKIVEVIDEKDNKRVEVWVD